MKRFVYIVGAGLTKALEGSYRVPLMQDFVSVLAEHLHDETILTHLAAMEADGLFENSTATTQSFAQRLANGEDRTSASRKKFKVLLQQRPRENIETLLQRSLDRKGSDSLIRFNFAINRFFCQIQGSLKIKPLLKFLRHQFCLPDARHTFVSYNYDLTLDRCVQQAGGQAWNVRSGYGFPIRHTIRPEQGGEHMKQFRGLGGAFAALQATTLSASTKDCSIQILKPHGSLNFVFPFENNYNFKDGAPIAILSGAGAITYYEGFDVSHVALEQHAMPEANRGLYLIPPTSAKPAKQSGLRSITAICDKVGQALRDADEVYVIGWSMPLTDAEQRQFIKEAVSARPTALERLTVVNYRATQDYIDRLAATFQIPLSKIAVFNEGFVSFVRKSTSNRVAVLPWFLAAGAGILAWVFWRHRLET